MRATLITSLSLITLLATQAHADALVKAEGSWGFDPDSQNEIAAKELACDADAMIVTISEDRKIYRGVRLSNEYHEADILESGENHLTLKYHGEKRMMGPNETQIWTMLFVDDNMFVWLLGRPGDIRSGPSDPRYRCRLLIG